MRFLGLALLVVVTASCKQTAPKGGQSESPRTPATAAAQGEGKSDEAGEEGRAEDPPDCAAGGAVWDGKLSCLYEVGGCCYDNPAQACAAGGCDTERCQVVESAPAGVYCE